MANQNIEKEFLIGDIWNFRDYDSINWINYQRTSYFYNLNNYFISNEESRAFYQEITTYIISRDRRISFASFKRITHKNKRSDGEGITFLKWLIIEHWNEENTERYKIYY